MMKYLLGVLLLSVPLAALPVNCDLTTFRWQCEIPVRECPSCGKHSILDCNGSNVYVTREEYEQIMRYQRASVFFSLKVNGEWITGPCFPNQYSPEFSYSLHRHIMR